MREPPNYNVDTGDDGRFEENKTRFNYANKHYQQQRSQPLMDFAQGFNYRSLIGQEVSDGLLRKGDQTSQGFIWDSSDEGVVIYNREHGDREPRYRTIKWGGNIRVKEQNPTGQLVGKIAKGKASRFGRGERK